MLKRQCRVMLPNHVYNYEGQVLVHVYILFEDGRSLDCGVIVTEFEKSWLDTEVEAWIQPISVSHYSIQDTKLV